MFDLFKSKSPAQLRDQAQTFYEKTVGDKNAPRAVKVRLGMLMRAHVDKLFVIGAKQAIQYDQALAAAITQGTERPDPPTASPHLTIKTGDNEVQSYIPPQYANAVFNLGMRYQTQQIGAEQAIEVAQSILDTICYEELALPQSFEALKFLRDELESESDEEGAD